MKPSVVSVVIPAYNCETYIAQTIDSVLSQDHKAIELIVIDDGSTDKTREIVRGYGHKLKLICQQNAGVCKARNRGIEAATGQFLCLLDHDDYWYPDKISRQLEAFANHPETGIVYSNFTWWFADESGRFPEPDRMSRMTGNRILDQEFSGWIYHQLLLDCWVLTSTALIRKEVFDRCGAFDESLPYSEDWDLWLRVSRVYPYQKLQNSTTLYRQHVQQGNKKVRSIDYRTVLLTEAVKKWGLCSPDNRCLDKERFYRQLADYHAAFGLHHLQFGEKGTGLRSFYKAWKANPFKLKFLAYLTAGWLGWKPKW